MSVKTLIERSASQSYSRCNRRKMEIYGWPWPGKWVSSTGCFGPGATRAGLAPEEPVGAAPTWVVRAVVELESAILLDVTKIARCWAI